MRHDSPDQPSRTRSKEEPPWPTVCRRPAPAVATAGADEPSVGTLVQSAMADVSTLIRAEIELAKAEVGKSAKKAGIGGGRVRRGRRRPRLLGLLLRHRLRRVPHLAGPRALDLLPDRLVPAGAARRPRRAGRPARSSRRSRSPSARSRRSRDLPEVLHREAPGAAPPRRARGQQRPGRAARQRVATRSERRPRLTVPPDGPPDATSVLLPGPVDPPRHLRQRHPAARRRGRRGPAGPAAARLPAVLVDLARAADRPGRGRLPRRRPGPARLRRQRQAAARLRPADPGGRRRRAGPGARRAGRRRRRPRLGRAARLDDGGPAPAHASAGWSCSRWPIRGGCGPA